ncbi:MAG: lipopolysaccharide kinase InaA family protein [Dissulfurimicrobium sp.]|uniref:lipopolysaccharide kinase InaA family protein n=1 Tax=Dissulfurimicrobium sp. TaxID=2022436 RepID=UPI00404A0EA6
MFDIWVRLFGGALYPSVPVSEGLEVADEWVSSFRDAGILDLDALWNSSKLNCFGKKNGRDISTMELDGKTLFVKRYQKKGWLSSVCSRPEGSSVEWAGAHILKKLGLKTFEPVAIGQDGTGRSILVVTKIDGERLEDFFKKDIPFINKINVIEMLADFAARFHSAGFTHQDFYLCHIFWNENTNEIGVIDLQRLRRTSRIVLPWVIKDIAQIGYALKNIFSSRDWERLFNIFWDSYKKRLPQLGDPGVMEKIKRKIARIEWHDLRRRRKAFQ